MYFKRKYPVLTKIIINEELEEQISDFDILPCDISQKEEKDITRAQKSDDVWHNSRTVQNKVRNKH